MKIGDKVTEQELEHQMYWFKFYHNRLEVWENATQHIWWDRKYETIEAIIIKKEYRDETQP